MVGEGRVRRGPARLTALAVSVACPPKYVSFWWARMLNEYSCEIPSIPRENRNLKSFNNYLLVGAHGIEPWTSVLQPDDSANEVDYRRLLSEETQPGYFNN